MKSLVTTVPRLWAIVITSYSIHYTKLYDSDTGIGIPKEQQDLIFKDFVQLDSDINKKAGGTGLGLYIVKKLIELSYNFV